MTYVQNAMLVLSCVHFGFLWSLRRLARLFMRVGQLFYDALLMLSAIVAIAKEYFRFFREIYAEVSVSSKISLAGK